MESGGRREQATSIIASQRAPRKPQPGHRFVADPIVSSATV
jgi:hypothetical protein